MESEDYGSLVQVTQRSINCLLDQDRNIRKTGLSSLAKELGRVPKSAQLRLLLTTNLCKNLLHTLNDPIEANRELALALLQQLLRGADLRREEADPIIQALVARIGSTPFPEKSEDLRERVLGVLRECLAFREAFACSVAEVSGALAKCLGDPSASIKQSCCQLVDDMCRELRTTVGKYSASIVKALSENLKHNRFQVRKTALATLAKLLVTEAAGTNFEHVSVGIKAALSDPKADVRRAALDCAAHLLKYSAPKYLKLNEPTLLSFLLGGLNDDSPDNIQRALALLEECGQSIRELEGEQMQD
jgi:hypothetical protein